jgi:hypothetical protein
MWNLQLFTITAAQKAKKKKYKTARSWHLGNGPLRYLYSRMKQSAQRRMLPSLGRRGCYSHPGKYFATLPTSRMVLRLRSRQRKNDRASERNGRVRAPAPVQELWRRPPSRPWAAAGELAQIGASPCTQELWRRPPSRPWAAAGELAHIGATTSTSRSRGRRRRPFAALGPRCLAVALCFSLVARLRRERKNEEAWERKEKNTEREKGGKNNRKVSKKRK